MSSSPSTPAYKSTSATRTRHGNEVRTRRPTACYVSNCPAFPGRSGPIEDTRSFCPAFFAYYNHEHYHSGIALHTPASVHGTVALAQNGHLTCLSELQGPEKRGVFVPIYPLLRTSRHLLGGRRRPADASMQQCRGWLLHAANGRTPTRGTGKHRRGDRRTRNGFPYAARERRIAANRHGAGAKIPRRGRREKVMSHEPVALGPPTTCGSCASRWSATAASP
jgi:hypothetical protein